MNYGSPINEPDERDTPGTDSTKANDDDNEGGQGALLADPHRTRSDMKLIRRAVREDWEIPPEARRTLPRHLYDKALNADDEKVQVTAAKVLVEMDKANKDNQEEEQGDRVIVINVPPPKVLERPKRD